MVFTVLLFFCSLAIEYVHKILGLLGICLRPAYSCAISVADYAMFVMPVKTLDWFFVAGFVGSECPPIGWAPLTD
jgi:hypothetical protein